VTLWSNIDADAKQHGQGHLIDHASQLSSEKHERYLVQLSQLDLALMKRLFDKSTETETPVDLSKLAMPTIYRAPRMAEEQAKFEQAKARGEAALRAGQVAVILVAGGQGTRLGHDAPKGTYAIGPVTQRTLFQIHAEKVLALSRRYGRDLPFLVMTSEENDPATKAFFQEHRNFGLKADQVRFFIQGMLPALDGTTGQVLLKAPGELALSPNGHGGVIEALDDAGLLERLENDGVTECYYFQVDNPLVEIADPAFLGYHLLDRAEMSLKVISKLYATERLGNLVEIDGRMRIIEYTELPEKLAEERTAEGELRIWAGSPAIHIFNVGFLRRLARGEIELPYHIARKAVAHLDASGEVVKPAKPNALKFERFVFDALPLAEKVVAMECGRCDEFEPLKNATGENSPESVRQALSDQYAGWLEAAGATVTRDAKGHAAVPIEISPLVALNAQDLRGKVKLGSKIDEPFVLQ
jgi:UDP-N-acetylglucosamine/UDP-N-acetylgalactosamine diphosphorylase